MTKQPEVVNLVNSPIITPKRNKEDVDMENEINQAIEAHNAAFTLNNADISPKEAFINVQQVSSGTT